MSFILDALKKSESDRQRQTGPALFEVKIAPPKSRLPLWAVAVAALLIVNLGIFGWLLVRHASRSEELAGTPTAARGGGGEGTGGAAAPANGSAVPSAAPVAGVQQATGHESVSPPDFRSAPSAGAGAGATNAGQAATSASSIPLSPKGPEYSGPTSASGTVQDGATPATREPTLARAGRDLQGGTPPSSSANPDDDIPAGDTGPQQDLHGHVKRGTASGLMLYQDLAVAAGANLPQLRLDLHVYAPKPQDRFALVNMQKVREGDTLQDGVHVESIVPDGVVMTHNGTKFLLPRD